MATVTADSGRSTAIGGKLDRRRPPALAISCYPLTVVLASAERFFSGIALTFAIAAAGCASSTKTTSPPADTGGGGSATGGSSIAATGGAPEGSGGAIFFGSGGVGGRDGSGLPGTGGRGTGGALGGGSGGSTGAGGGAGGTPLGGCPSNAIFCADFEAGMIPSQAVFFPAYLRSTISAYVSIDATLGFNSAHSARFSAAATADSRSQMLGVLTGTATFWTRVYLRSDVDVSANRGHATYMLATDGNGEPGAGEQIRVGEDSCQLILNRSSDDKELLSNGGSYMCLGGIVLAKDSWYCVETFYDGPGREVRVFVDGNESEAMHATDWGPYNYGMFKFGFENYSSAMRNIWYDDVAIAPQRIGCH